MNDPQKEDINQLNPWQQKLHKVIFGYDTVAGKTFDIALLVAIVLSVLAVMLESVTSISEEYIDELHIFEWAFTVLFTIEYVARIASSPNPKKYIFSFMGLIDLLSLLPTYLSFFFIGSHSLSILRSIRLIRIFRILKLTRYMGGANLIGDALWNSRHKIIVFLGSVICVVMIMGTVIYLVEGGENGFTSIPRSIYWSIVTITTVGYGDIAPQTVLGQFIASVMMIIGYAIIAVPTGIVVSDMTKQQLADETKSCTQCGAKKLKQDSNYCRNCGGKLQTDK